MAIDKRVCKQLIKEIRRCLGVPAAIFDLSGNVLAYTDDESLPSMLQYQKKLRTNAFTAEACHVLYAALHDAEQTDVCHVLVLEAADHPEYVGWIQTLLELCAVNQALLDRQLTVSNDRLSFVYQILSSSPQNDDFIVGRASKLKYDPYLPRCAIVFRLSDIQEGADPTAGEEVRKRLLQTIRETQGHDPGDFGDFLTSRQFILFKTVPSVGFEGRRAFLMRYIGAILEENEILRQNNIRIGVGTVYQDLRKMRESYREAQFVLKNLPVLDSSAAIGFVEDYTYDYLMSLLPEEHQRRRFEPYAERLRSVSYLPETLKSLVAQDCNLSRSARQLGIHRNTMLQRYAKLTEVTGLDPMHSERENLTARQCAVYLNRKTVLHAGIIIQSSSDLHRGCRHFSALLEEKSGNSISVEVLNVGLSGNNKSLLDLLICGALDFAVLDIDTLIPHAGEGLSVCNLPHVFDSYDDAYALLTGRVGQHLLKPLEKSGLIGLAFWTMGWRYFSSRGEPLRTPEQLKGRRVRTMDKEIMRQYVQGLGGTPITISYDNILAALAENIVDYQENPYVNFRDMHFYEQHDWILEEDSFFSTNAFITSAALWSKLTVDQQRIIREAAHESTLWQWQSARQHNLNCRERLQKKNGVRVYRPDPQEQACWREEAERFKRAFPHPDILEMIDEERREARHGDDLSAGL